MPEIGKSTDRKLRVEGAKSIASEVAKKMKIHCENQGKNRLEKMKIHRESTGENSGQLEKFRLRALAALRAASATQPILIFKIFSIF